MTSAWIKAMGLAALMAGAHLASATPTSALPIGGQLPCAAGLCTAAVDAAALVENVGMGGRRSGGVRYHRSGGYRGGYRSGGYRYGGKHYGGGYHYRHKGHHRGSSVHFSFGFGYPFYPYPFYGYPYYAFAPYYAYDPYYVYGGYSEVVVGGGGRNAEWIAYCARKHPSFNPRTGLYRTKSGKWRRCT